MPVILPQVTISLLKTTSDISIDTSCPASQHRSSKTLKTKPSETTAAQYQEPVTPMDPNSKPPRFPVKQHHPSLQIFLPNNDIVSTHGNSRKRLLYETQPLQPQLKSCLVSHINAERRRVRVYSERRKAKVGGEGEGETTGTEEKSSEAVKNYAASSDLDQSRKDSEIPSEVSTYGVDAADSINSDAIREEVAEEIGEEEIMQRLEALQEEKMKIFLSLKARQEQKNDTSSASNKQISTLKTTARTVQQTPPNPSHANKTPTATIIPLSRHSSLPNPLTTPSQQPQAPQAYTPISSAYPKRPRSPQSPDLGRKRYSGADGFYDYGKVHAMSTSYSNDRIPQNGSASGSSSRYVQDMNLMNGTKQMPTTHIYKNHEVLPTRYDRYRREDGAY
ncbi:hypothetical protein HK098_001550 [Nowakowskiella sp. JEL0407]|nr:hypothetical protein HK098_001550 [Nowakowskiella sp. JEL0407]